HRAPPRAGRGRRLLRGLSGGRTSPLPHRPGAPAQRGLGHGLRAAVDRRPLRAARMRDPIVLATCRAWPELSPSDRCLALILEQRGFRVERAPWIASPRRSPPA